MTHDLKKYVFYVYNFVMVYICLCLEELIHYNFIGVLITHQNGLKLSKGPREQKNS